MTDATLRLDQPRSDGIEYVSVPCPLCGSGESDPAYVGERFTGTSFGRIAVRVAQCSGCGFVFNSPRPSDADLARFYAEDALASGRTYRAEGAGSHYHGLFEERAAFYGRFLTQRPGGGRLLDVGCGRGGFLRALALELERSEVRSAWRLEGLEPGAESAAATREDGFEVACGYLGEGGFADASFDVVSLVSVLEHLTDPVAAVREVARLLRPDGLFLLEVPNTLHPELSLTSFFGLEHVSHFSPGTLSRLLAQHGLGDVAFDAGADRHVLRAVASAELASNQRAQQHRDDRAEVAAAIERYTTDERELIAGLDRHVRARLDDWRARGLSIAIYGAGVHTAELSEHVDLRSYAAFLVDGDPVKQGTEFLGLSVLAPEALRERGVGAVLLSSHRFPVEMERRVRSVCGDAVEVAACYPRETEPAAGMEPADAEVRP